jgi:hypothetical protein
VLAAVVVAGALALGLWRWSNQPLELSGARPPATVPPPKVEPPVTPLPLPESPPVPPPAARAAKRAPPPARSQHCTPPFTIDAAGHKRYKVECL